MLIPWTSRGRYCKRRPTLRRVALAPSTRLVSIREGAGWSFSDFEAVSGDSQVDGVDASSTLVVVVSKSFTTAETIMNAKTVKNWLTASIKADATKVVRQHVAAVSTQMQLTKDFGIASENVFAFGDYVGGRFSVHSPVGVLPLALQYGMAPLREFLGGAHAMDLHFKNTPLERNLPVLLGLLGLYNSTFLGFNCKAILPYAQALLRFAAHIQQLDMESNGKRVAMDGSTLPFEAGEICFGEPGTNGQHSFYQLMHQGRVVPAEFIGFKKSQAPVTLAGNALFDSGVESRIRRPRIRRRGDVIQSSRPRWRREMKPDSPVDVPAGRTTTSSCATSSRSPTR